MNKRALYIEETPSIGEFDVVFLNEAGIKLVRQFTSPFLANKFIRKVRKSKKCTLVSYPTERS